MTRNFAIALLMILPLPLAGCSQRTIDSADHDAQTDAKIVRQGAVRAEKKIDPEVNSLDWGARVSAAINLNANLPKTIRVDASPNGVRLKGVVHDKSQKTLAARVAEDTLPPDKTVENDLSVGS